MSFINNTKFIFIEGNIGAGKTSVIKHLKLICGLENNSFNFIIEPLEQYRKMPLYNNSFLKHKNLNNIETKHLNVLDQFYNEKMSGFENQTYIISVLLSHILDNIKENHINIIERSVYSAIFVFSKALYEIGRLNLIDFSILENYKKLFKLFLNKKNVTFIFLNTSHDVCFKRIKIRNRPEEKNISLTYLNSLSTFHNEMEKELNLYYNIKTIDTTHKSVESLGEEIYTYINELK